MRVAKALVYDNDGYVLVLYRSATHPMFALQSDLPGGIIEDGEDYAEGLAREIAEEAGITADPGRLELLAETNTIGRSHKQLFALRLGERPEVILSWEHERYEWVAAEDIGNALRGGDTFNEFARSHLRQNDQ